MKKENVLIGLTQQYNKLVFEKMLSLRASALKWRGNDSIFSNTNFPGRWGNRQGAYRRHASAPGAPGRAVQYTREERQVCLD